MKHVQELYRKYGEIIRYLIAGVLTTAVSLGTYYVCVATFLNPDSAVQLQAANVLAWIVSVTFAYFTNRKYVFESHNRNVMKEAGRFYLSRISTLIMDMGLMFLMVTMGGMNDRIAKLIVQVVVMAANYLFSRILVFKK